MTLFLFGVHAMRKRYQPSNNTIARQLTTQCSGSIRGKYGVFVEDHHAYLLPDHLTMFAPGRARIAADGNGKESLVLWTPWSCVRLPLEAGMGKGRGEIQGCEDIVEVAV